MFVRASAPVKIIVLPLTSLVEQFLFSSDPSTSSLEEESQLLFVPLKRV